MILWVVQVRGYGYTERIIRNNARLVRNITTFGTNDLSGMKYETMTVCSTICGSDGRSTSGTLGKGD